VPKFNISCIKVYLRSIFTVSVMWILKLWGFEKYMNQRRNLQVTCVEEACLRVAIYSQKMCRELMVIRVVSVTTEKVLYLFIYYHV